MGLKEKSGEIGLVLFMKAKRGGKGRSDASAFRGQPLFTSVNRDRHKHVQLPLAADSIVIAIVADRRRVRLFICATAFTWTKECRNRRAPINGLNNFHGSRRLAFSFDFVAHVLHTSECTFNSRRKDVIKNILYSLIFKMKRLRVVKCLRYTKK